MSYLQRRNPYTHEEVNDLLNQFNVLLEERDSWRRIAKAGVRALRSKDFRVDEILQPGGLWILEKDRETFRQALKGSSEGKVERPSTASFEQKSAWVWAKPGEPHRSRSHTPAYMFPQLEYFDDLEREEAWINKGYHGVARPAAFRRTFPLEIFLLIASECDQPTLRRLAQASYSCLELFSGPLHRRIDFREDDYVFKLFPPRPNPASPRISPHLNLHNLRVLEIHSAAAARSSWPNVIFSPDRLEPYDDYPSLVPGALQLDTLVIYFNPQDLSQEHDEFKLFDPNPDLLSFLNPSNFVAGTVPGKRFPSNDRHESSYGNAAVLLARRGALAMSSNWSRLETILLHSIDLFVTSDDKCWEEDTIEQGDERVFFYGLGGTTTVASPSVRIEWRFSLTWTGVDSQMFTGEGRALGGLGGGRWDNVVEAFALRDDTLIRFGSSEGRRCRMVLRSQTRNGTSLMFCQEALETLGEPYKSCLELVESPLTRMRGRVSVHLPYIRLE